MASIEDLSGALREDAPRRSASLSEKVAAQLAVSMPELGWSVCEPLFMPLLLELKASHDMLVTPTRAQMNDIFPPDEAESRSATVAGLAKILAILCAMLLSRTAAFLVVATMAAGATLAQLVARPGKQRSARQVSFTSLDEGYFCPSGLSNMWQITKKHPGFWEMWMLQFAGWLSVCTWSFYFSSVWADIQGTQPGTAAFDDAVHQATQWLLYGSIVFLASGTILPYLSGPASLCRGEWTGMFVAVWMMTLTLFLLCLAKIAAWLKWLAVVFVCLAMPIAYQVLANAPFAWLERQPAFDAENRGLLTGIFNAALATSQAATALLSGPIVASFNGQLWTALAAAGIVDLVILSSVALSSFSTWLRHAEPAVR
eukprot:Skav233676  [mRNA]  locus=scaffold1927:43400:46505:- [translate_table: standard]